MSRLKRIVSSVDRPTAARSNAKDTFELAIQFEQREDLPAAEAGYRQADKLGHAEAATRLGILLEERDDLAGAEQAYRRADKRGDADGAFALGWLLGEGGDVAGAEAAYRRAEGRGHPGAAGNLRMLLNGRRPAVSSAGAATAALARPAAAAGAAAGAGAPVKPWTRTSGQPLVTSLKAEATKRVAAATSHPHGTDSGRRTATSRRPRRSENRPAPRGRALRWLASAALVFAFAASFALGSQGRHHAAAAVHAAPAASVSQPTVTISRVAPVGKPAALKLHRKSKPKTKHKPKPKRKPKPRVSPAPASAVVAHPVYRAAPVYRPEAPAPPAPAAATPAQPSSPAGSVSHGGGSSQSKSSGTVSGSG